MRKARLFLLAATLLFSSALFAAGINFIENKAWKEVLAMAKKQNKLIFLDAYTTWCGPCKYLQKNVFTNSEVGSFYNKNFINVKMDMEKGEGIGLAIQYEVTSYPTLFFINGNGELVHKTVGAMEAEDFVALGKDAINPEAQYFTVKRKAPDGKINPESFHNWVHSAEGMEDPETDDIIRRYLANTGHPIMEVHMISMIMDHAKILSKAQLDLIYKNREQAAKMLEVTGEAFDHSLIDLVTAYSLTASMENDVLDFDKFKKTVEAYYPARAALETQKMKVTYHVEKNETTPALAALDGLIRATTFSVPVADMAMAVVNATNMIAVANKGDEFIKKVEGYKVNPGEAKQSYYKDLALLMLHFRMEHADKVKLYSDKIINNEDVPQAIVEMVKGLIEE